MDGVHLWKSAGPPPPRAPAPGSEHLDPGHNWNRQRQQREGARTAWRRERTQSSEQRCPPLHAVEPWATLQRTSPGGSRLHTQLLGFPGAWMLSQILHSDTEHDFRQGCGVAQERQGGDGREGECSSASTAPSAAASRCRPQLTRALTYPSQPRATQAAC